MKRIVLPMSSAKRCGFCCCFVSSSKDRKCFDNALFLVARGEIDYQQSEPIARNKLSGYTHRLVDLPQQVAIECGGGHDRMWKN